LGGRESRREAINPSKDSKSEKINKIENNSKVSSQATEHESC